MHKLYNVKDKLIRKIEEYDENGDISRSDAEEIKILSSAADHLCNICKDAEAEEDYSMRSYPDGMGGMTSRRYSRTDGTSMARGRMNARRESMGRYSGADGEIEDIKRDMQRLMEKVDKM